MMPLSIILAGTPNTTVTVAKALTLKGYTIVHILCPFPKPIGRKHIVTPCALEQWAIQKNIPRTHVDAQILKEEDFTHKLPICDLLVVADFRFLIPPTLLKHPKYGALNVHPSLLPRWRGATPVPFSLLFRDEDVGVSIISMEPQYDTGAIVAQQSLKTPKDIQAQELLTLLFDVGSELLVKIIPQFCEKTLPIQKQEKDSPTPYAKRFTKEDGYIPLQALHDVIHEGETREIIPLLKEYSLPHTAAYVHAMICALSPWPGVWTLLPDGKRAKLIKSHVDGKKLVLEMVQIEGRNTTPYKDVKHYFEAALT